MLGTNDVLSIQNISMQKIEGGGGSVSMQKIEEQRHQSVQWGGRGGRGLLTPRPLPSIGLSDHTYFLLLNKVL